MQGQYRIAAAAIMAVTAMAAVLAPGSAFARTDVSVNIGIPGPAIMAPGPVYAPPPVYAAPAPMVIAPPPVVYAPRPHYWRGPPPGHWRHDRGWDRRDYDRRDWHHRR